MIFPPVVCYFHKNGIEEKHHANSRWPRPLRFVLVLIALLISVACRLSASQTPHPIDPTVTPSRIPVIDTATPEVIVLDNGIVDELPDAIHQWAVKSVLNPGFYENIAVFEPDSASACGENYLADLPEPDDEIILTLTYATPLVANQVNLVQNQPVDGIVRIELLNSTSGLGTVVYEPGYPVTIQHLQNNPCDEIFSIPVHSEMEADIIFITFASMTAASRLDAVELVGQLKLFNDAPVFWRVPLTGDAAGIAINELGVLYVATDPNELYNYDIEGNQYGLFTLPMETTITDITCDTSGNVAVLDSVAQKFRVLSPAGEELLVGEAIDAHQIAISLQDGNIFTLTKIDNQTMVRVYPNETGNFWREFSLGDHQYVGLAFDPAGYLYTIRYWDNLLVKLDPLTGKELDVIPLFYGGTSDVSARDLVIDANGNIYILFNINTGQIAIHQLDPQGNLIQRFGGLTASPLEDRPEGTFFEPSAISVTADGRFVIIADGYGETSYLTVFLMEID